MNKKKKTSMENRVFNIINISFFILLSVICIYPFYYIIINSISDSQLVNTGRINFFAKGIHFENYKKVFELKTLSNAAKISVLRTIIGTSLTVFISSIAGYIFSRPEVWHRKFFFRLIFLPGYISAGMIAGFINIRNLGLMNNFLVYILPGAFNSYFMILIKTYIESGIPPSLEEAAYIDGASYIKRYLQIVMPICKPILATCAIFAAVGQWNSFMDTVLYCSRSSLQTLQSILYQFMNQAENLANMMKDGNLQIIDLSKVITPAAIRYTVTTVTVLPILMVYPFFQKYFTKGIMLGAVKG